MSVSKKLVEIINESQKKGTSAYDTQGEVVRVDGNTAWVHFAGGVDETPVRMTINANVGDNVQVRVSGGDAFLIGNGTAPPTDNTTANYAVRIAQDAGETINIVQQDVTVMQTVVATKADIEELNAVKADVEDLEVQTAKIEDLTAEQLSATVGYIEDLTTGSIDASDIIADHATIDSLDSNYAHITNGVIDNAKIGYADVNNLSTHYASIDLANVDNAWIEDGVIKDAAISDAQIIGVSANKLTAGTIDAGKINVANLNAKNLIVEKINGQPILGGYETVSPNSSGYAQKNPSTEGWYEYVNGAFVASTDTSVDATKTYYKSGTQVALYDQTYIDGIESGLQQQIDGAVETYTGNVVPTLVNYPAVDWSSAQMANHVGDIYYVINAGASTDGYCYRFAYDNSTSTYSWVLIKDSDVTAALSRLTTAEGKITGLESFESTTSSWITNTDEELSSIKTNHTTLVGVVDKTLVSTVQLWFTKADTTAPSKPTAHVTNNNATGSNSYNKWNIAVPTYNASYPNYYYCYEWAYADGTYGWSAVTRDIAMGETQSTARTAESTANSNIKSTVQLWFTKENTTAPSKPTSHVTNNNATGSNSYNKWNLAVPEYNASYPNYFFCYEYQKGDNSYSWSDVVLDRATTENQANARSALSQVATKVETSTFNTLSQTVDTNTANITSLSSVVETKADGSTVTTLSNTVNEVSQTASGNSSKISNLTTTFGTNADGTTKTGDIVHRTSAVEQDLTGFKSTVSTTYATKTELGNKADASTVYTKSEIDQKESAINLSVSAKADASSTAASLALKANKDTLTSEINASADTVKISADRLNITGVITAINDDSTTTIDGGRISTGTIIVGALDSDVQDILTNADNTLIYDHTYEYTTDQSGKKVSATFTAYVYKGGVDVKTDYDPTCFSWYLKKEDTDGQTKETLLGTGYTITVTLDNCGYGAEIIGRFTTTDDSEALSNSNDNLTNANNENLTVRASGDAVRVRDLSVTTTIFPTDKIMVIGASDEHLVSVQTLQDYLDIHLDQQVLFNTTAGWNAQTSLVSDANTLYVYTDHTTDSNNNNVAGIKAGDGLAYVVDLPFIDAVATEHIADDTIHITSAERTAWNNKVRCYYAGTENLVFTTA